MTNPADISRGIVLRSRDSSEIDEAAAVLEAVGIDYDILPWESEYLLIVLEEVVPFAERQLRAYKAENSENLRLNTSGPDTAVFPPLSKGIYGALLYVTVLLLIDGLLHNNIFHLDLLNLGSSKAGLIREGEWWRAVTALTLHSGFPHLIGNISFGVIFGLFASQALGTGLAWFLILLAGTIGNLLSAFIHAPEHTAIGASTAVFAALGIQSASTWRTWHLPRYRGIRRWSPIIGGIILLGLLGGPGERIDVGSHVTGFFSGIFFGILFGSSANRLKCKEGCQALLGLAALATIALSWMAAITLS